MATKVTFRYANSEQWHSDVVLGGKPDQIVKAYLKARPQISEIKLSEINNDGGTPDDDDLAERESYPWHTRGANRLANLCRKFELWFNKRYGWFFTNGYKAPRHAAK